MAAAYRAKRDLPKYGIRKGQRVDRDHKAVREDKGDFVAEGDDFRRDEQAKQNERRGAARRRRWW